MTRVLIVVGIRLYREGLAQLLAAHTGLAVVGTASNGRTAAARIEHLVPDVALVEMGIPDLDVIAAALAGGWGRGGAGVGAGPPPRPHPAPHPAGRDRDCRLRLGGAGLRQRGAAGYVTRDASVEELAAAIERAARGELVCSPRTAGTLIRRLGLFAAELRPDVQTARLTRRERGIGALIGEDLSNKEIATRLRIEVATVKNHVHNVLDKLQLRRRTEIARVLGPMTRSSR